MTSLTPGMMRLVGKKHHLVTVRRNIRLTITYYHPTSSFSPSMMRLGNTKRHLPTVKRNIRLTITYCRPMSSISPSMMRLIDKKCHLAIARGNIWPAITYCLSMFSLSYFMMRLLESNNINVECRQLLLFPTSYLWRVDGSASVFSSQPHPSLSLFTFTFHFFFCYHPSPPVDHLYFPSSQFTSVDIYCCGLHYLCLSWSICILRRNLFVLEL